MKRIVIRTGIVLVLVAVFLAGTLTLNRGWSGSRLERYKGELRARGEKLLVSELASGRGETNTMIPRLVQAHNQLGRAAPPANLMRIVSPGLAYAAARRTNTSPSMHGLLDESAVPLATIRDALKSRPRDLGWSYTNRSSYPGSLPLIEIRRAAQWLGWAIAMELDRIRRGPALTNLLSLLDVAHCHEQEGTLVSQMIRIAVAGMAFMASWEGLQVGGWTDAELAELQHSWEDLSLGRAVEFSLQMERAVVLTYFESGRHGNTNAFGLIVPASSFAEGFYDTFWQMALSKGDELHYLRTIQNFLDALRAAREKRSSLEFQKRLDSGDGWFARYRFPLSSVVRRNIGKALTRWLRMETERQLVLAAIGVERFRLRHGRYPESLGELVPEILRAVPVDFGDGQPIRYEREGNGFRLWSVMEGAQWPRAESEEK
jgi:hypothetical protein